MDYKENSDTHYTLYRDRVSFMKCTTYLVNNTLAYHNKLEQWENACSVKATLMHTTLCMWIKPNKINDTCFMLFTTINVCEAFSHLTAVSSFMSVH